MREGHQVETVDSGPAALELTLSHAFDLILLDLVMPEMNGFEVLRRLKSAQHTRHVPVIVISALDELDSVVRCIEAGAEDYLTKPFDPILLRARIGACLEKKWLRDREQKFVGDLDLEKRRSDALLLNILPQSIVTRMRNGEMVIADRFTEATILFCDLVGFTVISQDLPADRTVDFLGQIFSTFDRLAAEHGVEKIKTIGDAYMAAAGIPEPQPDHAIRVAELAPRMLRRSKRSASPPSWTFMRASAFTPAQSSRDHWDTQVHLRRLGRYREYGKPDGILFTTRPNSRFCCDAPCAWESLQVQTPRANPDRREGDDGNPFSP